MTSFLKDGRSRPVAVWLFAVAAMVFAMVVVGGATRLTGSGLSITEWKPVTGALPPMSDAAWRADFALYRATPQYRLLNEGMTLGQFQFIYWWEWSHRLLGRLVGAVFALPFLAFLVTRRMPVRLIWRCVVLLALGGLQGTVGWWMVQSGLEARVSVAPERLAAHLGLALVLFAALIWTGLEAWSGQGRADEARRDGWTTASTVLAVAVFMQCLLGALVAGNQAGRINTDWPLMSGRFFPGDYDGGGPWATLAHSRAAVQFNHRILAYLILAGGVVSAIRAISARTASDGVTAAALAFGLALAAQVGLGIVTLMAAAPLPLAMAHQALAAVLLAAGVVFAWRSRRA
jgi:cytochrome c oxidase assembly protein subunit 15